MEPPEDSGDLRIGLPGILLGEIKDEGAAEGSEVALEGVRRIGGDEEERGVVGYVNPAEFDCGAGLSDAAHAVDCLSAAD